VKTSYELRYPFIRFCFDNGGSTFVRYDKIGPIRLDKEEVETAPTFMGIEIGLGTTKRTVYRLRTDFTVATHESEAEALVSAEALRDVVKQAYDRHHAGPRIDTPIVSEAAINGEDRLHYPYILISYSDNDRRLVPFDSIEQMTLGPENQEDTEAGKRDLVYKLTVKGVYTIRFRTADLQLEHAIRLQEAVRMAYDRHRAGPQPESLVEAPVKF